MSIKILNIKDAKLVKKPWGHERWIADGSPDFKYALKEIFFKSSYSSSIQFHEFKEETTYIKEGHGILHYSDEPIDIKKFHEGGYSNNDLKKIINNMKKQELLPGTIYHIKPGYVHRVQAIDDLITIESSTIELDDVYRLNDDWGRVDGKVAGEHFEKLGDHELYKEQIARYEFASTLVKGKVLDITYGSFMPYFGAKILLERNALEVWHQDVSNNEKQCSVRKLSKNNSIEFELKEGNEVQFADNSFDCIISSLILQHAKHDEAINEYYRILKNDGLLIISTKNKDLLLPNTNFDTEKINQLTREGLQTLLKQKFNNITLYSQREISKKEEVGRYLKYLDIIKGKVREYLGKTLLKVDKNSNFYKLHLQKTMLNVDASVNKLNKKFYNVDYVPKPYLKGSRSKFFIAICKKN